jgi:hypothetical protein
VVPDSEWNYMKVADPAKISRAEGVQCGGFVKYVLFYILYEK